MIAHFNLDGDIIPLKVRLKTQNEECIYAVEHPGKPVKGASLKIGIQGDRYSCRIDGKKANLYRDLENKWFIEII